MYGLLVRLSNQACHPATTTGITRSLNISHDFLSRLVTMDKDILVERKFFSTSMNETDQILRQYYESGATLLPYSFCLYMFMSVWVARGTIYHIRIRQTNRV